MSEIAAFPVPPRLFDPKMTLAVLVTLGVQGAAVLLWVGAAAQRIDALERAMQAQAPVAERLARLESELGGARAALERIESRLDRQGGGQ